MTKAATRTPWRRLVVAGGLVLLLALVSMAGYLAYSQYQARSNVRAIQEALTNRSWSEAYHRANLAVRSAPEDPLLHLLAARAARRLDNVSAATEHLNTSERLQKGETQAVRVERALLRLHGCDLEGTEGFLRECLAQNDPDAPEILDGLAVALIYDYRLPEAHQLLDELLRRQPDDYDVLVRQAWTAENQAWNTVAVESLEKALRLRPDADSARFALVNNLLTLGRHAEALEHVTRLRERQADNPQVFFAEAQCLAGQGRKEQALELLDIVVNAGKANWPILAERGWLLLELDRPEEAESWLRRAHSQAPPDRTLLMRLSDCLRLLGKEDEARQYREQAERLHRDTVQALLLTKRYRGEGRHDPELCHELGVVLLRIAKDQDAVNFFQKALKVDPQRRATHRALADYYTKVGAATQAEIHKQQAGAGHQDRR